MHTLELIEKKTIMYTVMAVLFFSAVNQTIVGTTLPSIVSSLGGMEYFNWVFTIFMLTSSISSILAGKLSDTYGRKPFFIIGILTLSLASLMCGFSNTMIELIIYRGFQGLGAGIIISLSFASVGDLFLPRERGRWQGLLTSVFGLSSLIGPTMGGYIVDHFDWHWIFWIFLPFGVVAFFVLLKFYPSKKHIPEKLPVDYSGILSFTISVSLLLYYLSILGIKPFSIARESLLITGIVFLALFVYLERKAIDPILPPPLFYKNTYLISNVVSFFVGMGMFGVVIYIPFYMQGPMQISATYSGIIMMCMTLSLVSLSSIVGNQITRTGKYKFIGIFGVLIMLLGLLSMYFMNIDSSLLSIGFRVILFGAGLGIGFTVFTLSVQFEVSNRQIGIAVSSVQLFRQIGGTIGVALLGGVFNTLMGERKISLISGLSGGPSSDISKNLLNHPRILLDHQALKDLLMSADGESLNTLQSSILLLRENMGSVLNEVFLLSSGILVLALFISFSLKEVSLESNEEKED